MGRDSYAVCNTCKEVHYLGYGSCTTWYDQAQTVSQWDDGAKANPDAANLWKNLLYRTFLQVHEAHDIFTYSSDWISEKDEELYHDYDCTLFRSIKGFKHIDNYEGVSDETPERSYNAWRMMLGDVQMLWPRLEWKIIPGAYVKLF